MTAAKSPQSIIPRDAAPNNRFLLPGTSSQRTLAECLHTPTAETITLRARTIAPVAADQPGNHLSASDRVIERSVTNSGVEIPASAIVSSTSSTAFLTTIPGMAAQAQV